MAAPTRSILDQPIASLRGIGEKKGSALTSVGIHTVDDLLSYFPRRYIDRSSIRSIVSLQADEETTVVGKVVSMGVKQGRRNRFVLVVTDGTDYLSCIWFGKVLFWQKIFRVGEWLALSGKVALFGGPRMVHPEFDRLGPAGEGDFIHTGKIIPLYPSSEALTKLGFDSRGFRRCIAQVLKEIKGRLPEILPETVLKRHKLFSRSEAVRHIHFPADFSSLEKARQRLKFDELFFMELLVGLRKQHLGSRSAGIAFERVGEPLRRLVQELPFELTGAQKRVLHEIRADMKKSTPMNRLLQGDVGSGKTIVAVFTMLIAVENGYQAALMAPTEILAEQHYLTIHRMLEALGVHVVLLIGGQTRRARQAVLTEISEGRAHIIVGTHALIQESVEYRRLGLVIVDEQHRFGVLQRAQLREKGLNPDLLVMTATPIPRTLSMTVYGDLDVSILNELPANRKPIRTFWRPQTGRAKIYEFVRKQMELGAQAYVVFPLVEETEKSDLKSAVDSYEKMKCGFFSAFEIGLLHGRMKTAEKEQVMDEFKSGRYRLLVSTTVIEVGVDVANATLMVVEHAERFGLTQLHQLRGRVGRGEKQSYCILIAYGNLGAEAKRRLETLTETTDGFKIAEVDLELRGPGEFFGTRQHGLPELKLANVIEDTSLLLAARDEAFKIAQEDPQLRKAENGLLREHFIKHYREKYESIWIG
ncbi:MAG: ATP-dependent DNA helicase RecG [bacterium ADurb.Bin478]|nr:MAG: ATP-dependent DNA helicase RecG [bacterium ADurb.Bin478]